MIAAERETSVAFTDADEVVRIYTARRADITGLRRKGFEPTGSGEYDGGEWAMFEIPTSRFKLPMAVRPPKRELSPEKRAALAERMLKAREAR